MKKQGNLYLPRKNPYLSSFLTICFLSLIWYTLPFFFFPLEDIHIYGNYYISEEIIRERLDHLKGRPLLRISQGYVSSLLDNGWVKKVEIYRLPSHILIVKIKERNPFLIISPEKGSPLLVDEEGFVIESSTQISSLPILFLPSVEVEENKMISLPYFKDIKEIFDQLKETPIKIENLSLSPTGELSLSTQGGIKIIIGEQRELFQKLFLLKTLWGKIPNIEKRLNYINLSCPYKPAIMEMKNK